MNSRCPVVLPIVPQMTRRALRPEIGTSRGWPRRPHAARNGGNSNRSVSSSNSLTQRGGRAAISRRMRRFFVALRVGSEHVARPLPDVVQGAELLADGGRGDTFAVPVLQVLLQEADRPLQRLVAEVGRPPLQGGNQRGLKVLG